jgi:hypothetical protein
MTVEHVHVYPGGQAILGQLEQKNIEIRGRTGHDREQVFTDSERHAQFGMAEEWQLPWRSKQCSKMRSKDSAWNQVSGAHDDKRSLPDAWRQQYRSTHSGGSGTVAKSELEAWLLFR